MQRGCDVVEDSTPPGAPSGVTVVPASPANNNAPVVMGGAEASSTVRLFVTSDWQWQRGREWDRRGVRDPTGWR